MAERWKERYPGVKLVAFAAELGQGDELKGIEDKARKSGADEVVVMDLRRYERWRRSENELMSAAIDAFDRLLARGSGRVAEVAQRGLPMVQKSGLVKRAFIERAMGLVGELPTAAR